MMPASHTAIRTSHFLSHFFVVSVVSSWLILLAVAIASAENNPRTFENPILSGFYPDPSICRVGDDYYLVHSTFEYFPGVPIFHSRDLVHWRQIGHVLTRPSQLPLEKMRASGGVFAPTLRYYKGTFYLVTTNVWGTGNFYMTATDPAGPWSEPHSLDQEGIDPSLFFDDDDTVYYIRHVGGEDGYIGQQVLDLATGNLQGEMKKIWGGTGGVWAEGPHMYKKDGAYYLMISEGGTSYNHMVTIARSDSPWGPFEACPDNPILTHLHRPEHTVQALGHADLVETPAGWWAVFLGIRPQGGRFHHLGRETFLAPVTWSGNGWPMIGDGGAIEVEMTAPSLSPHPWPEEPARDEFDAEKLGLQWNFLRNPRPGDRSLAERPGYLRLMGSAVTLSDQDSPAFVGRRQTGMMILADARLEFNPQRENEEAGLTVRGNDANHVDLGVTLRDGKKKFFLRKVFDGKIVEPVKYHEVEPGVMTLSFAAKPGLYGFTVSFGEGQHEKIALGLGGFETKLLSSEAIGGFTGVIIGMYATGNGKRSTTPADFDWFEYKVVER